MKIQNMYIYKKNMTWHILIWLFVHFRFNCRSFKQYLGTVYLNIIYWNERKKQTQKQTKILTEFSRRYLIPVKTLTVGKVEVL